MSPAINDWGEHLRLVQIAVNHAWQDMVSELHCLLIFGRQRCLRTPLTVGFPSACSMEVTSPAAGELAVKMQQLTPTAKKFMFAAQQRQKHSWTLRSCR